MADKVDARLSLPSVDRMLRHDAVRALLEDFGRRAVTGALRLELAEARRALSAGDPGDFSETVIARRCAGRLHAAARPSLRPVLNLTGTVLHTNLGRALLPREALQGMTELLWQPCNLEYGIAEGCRGDRDSHVEGLLCELTGAEAATVVNNNAAAVLLVLNTLALRREVVVSRGELVEIGDTFRIPDIMARAGCRLREVGTTNRTHLADYRQGIGPRTGLLMKVHPSNYEIRGFTSLVEAAELATLARECGLPFAVDLGSGALVDLSRYGLPREPLPQEALAAGADLVTFSGDKLLGGPQAGLIVGREAFVTRLKRNALKRALRVDKLTLAALEAVLRLYRHPERLAERLPALRHLTRPAADIEAQAQRLAPLVQLALGGAARVAVEPCASEIGSGALPADTLASTCLAIRPASGRRGNGAALDRLARAFRSLPLPAIGRIEQGALRFDLRCLDNEAGFTGQLARLQLP